MKNIPGFTAEASLYKTNYYCHAIIETNHDSGGVQPALISLRDWNRPSDFIEKFCTWVYDPNRGVLTLSCKYEWI